MLKEKKEWRKILCMWEVGTWVFDYLNCNLNICFVSQTYLIIEEKGAGCDCLLLALQLRWKESSDGEVPQRKCYSSALLCSALALAKVVTSFLCPCERGLPPQPHSRDL